MNGLHQYKDEVVTQDRIADSLESMLKPLRTLEASKDEINVESIQRETDDILRSDGPLRMPLTVRRALMTMRPDVMKDTVRKAYIEPWREERRPSSTIYWARCPSCGEQWRWDSHRSFSTLPCRYCYIEHEWEDYIPEWVVERDPDVHYSPDLVIAKLRE